MSAEVEVCKDDTLGANKSKVTIKENTKLDSSVATNSVGTLSVVFQQPQVT